ncbi:Glycosyltransferase family 23 (GT23) domain [Cinara cedri]|uniref:Glycosyltransferase family 23 (GT23) domain n=1 Tax=Cinara cedri TaxID=506608 RepID=A0A5E4M3L4_9HEMI|nr:Glycosyltransferase family 23 (GT23) domain [Cinara cedri]
MRRQLSWLQGFCFFALLWAVYLIVNINNTSDDPKHNNLTEENRLNQTLTDAFLDIAELHDNNTALSRRVIDLRKKLEYLRTQNSNKTGPKEPSEKYELLRRRIYSNTNEFWYYVNAELKLLVGEVKNLSCAQKMIKITDEHFRSLITDVAKLAEVDGHDQWRQREHQYLSDLIERRLMYLQNPPDCSKAKKLACRFVSKNRCGFECRLHHLVDCMIVAYATGRTMVMDDPQSWNFTSDEWNALFLPLSDTCESADGETVSPWPGDKSTQVVTLNLPMDNYDSHQKPPLFPQVLPEDLATRINVLHGDPVTWWKGQFLKYIFRARKSTVDKYNAYINRVKFQKPCVGVHIKQTDLIDADVTLHELSEYMYHVEKYYKLKELNSSKLFERRIYLSTNEPEVFNIAKLKYPEYTIIGDPAMFRKTRTPENPIDPDDSIMNAIIDVHLLSLSDYLVCTFSSNACRLAYEIMNGFRPSDASALFKPLGYTSQYYSNRKLHVAILPHSANGLEEMDLRVGDQIEVAGNRWGGFSKGTNIRTKQFLLYPTFKAIPKLQALHFATYPNVTMNSDALRVDVLKNNESN